MSLNKIKEGFKALLRHRVVNVGFVAEPHHLATIEAAFYDTTRPVLKRRLSELHEAMGGGALVDGQNIKAVLFSEEISTGTISEDIFCGRITISSPAPTEDQECES